MTYEAFFNLLLKARASLENLLSRATQQKATPCSRAILTLYLTLLLIPIYILISQSTWVRQYNTMGSSIFFSGFSFLIPWMAIGFLLRWPRILIYLGSYLILIGMPILFYAKNSGSSITRFVLVTVAIFLGMFLARRSESKTLIGVILYQTYFWLAKFFETIWAEPLPNPTKEERILMLVYPKEKSFSFFLSLHPVQYLYPLPRPRPTVQTTVENSAHYLTILLAPIYIILAGGIRHIILATIDLSNTSAAFTLLTGWLNYVYFYLNSTALVGASVALLGISGFPTSAGTDLSFWSTNPADRWRRWNTFLYEWLFKYVYLPSYRRFQNHFFCIVTVFFVTFLFHHAHGVTAWLVGLDRDFEMYYRLVFFMAHAGVVYLALVLPKLFPQNWFGFLFTQFLMALIHLIPAQLI